MSSTHNTRARKASAATAKAAKPRAAKGSKRDRSSSGVVERPVTMSAKERQLLDELKAKEALMAKQQAGSHKAGVRSKAAAQTIAEASDEEDEQPVPKRRRLRVREESDADEADGDGQGSQGSAAQEDVAAAEDREDEPVQTKPTQRRKNVHDLLALAASHSPMLSEAKPRPIFKGKAVEPVATEDEGTDSEMGNEQPQEGDRSQAIGSTRQKKAPGTPRKETKAVAGAAPQSPSKGKGKANAEPQGISGVSGRKADGRTRQASKVDRQVLDYVEVVSVTAKKGEGKTASKTASSKTSATRKTLFTPIPDEVVSSEDEEEHHRSDSEEEDELDDDSREADADGDDVVMLQHEPSDSKEKGKKGKKGPTTRNRNRALATSLPDSISPVKNLAAMYLKMYIALEAAWTKYTSMSHSRLLDRHDVIEKVIISVREHKNKDGRCPPEVKEAFEELSNGPEADSLQKTLTEVVWQGASQMRNDLKKKAKLVADEAYGLTGMKAQQKRALATWLTTSCRETLKDGIVVNVPNFIFPVVEVVWVDGQRGNKSSYVDSAEASTEMSESKLNTRMPFQHPAISKLIYAFWFSGQTQAEVNARREKFSVVPDNLIALVCNALEAALKDHLQASAGNALDLQFSNKIYAPKWDDLMTLLEGIQSLSPAGYQSMKTVIWGRINAKLKEDEKVHGLEEESSPGRPTNRIPFHDLATNEVDVDDLNLDGGELARHKTRADRDKAEADVAGTQQAGAGTLVDFTPLPPAGGDSQATSPPPAQVQAATSTVEVANTSEGRVSRAGSVGMSGGSAASTAEGQGPEEE
ncbi:hypothetical protein C8Q72DRAFT_796127 [Fomitopsis betulina]|nr:hypothetical protein C8Q72DRAFT_796127 [Fomitopsis betulina]